VVRVPHDPAAARLDHERERLQAIERRLDLGLRGLDHRIAARLLVAARYQKTRDRKSTRLNSSHSQISYAVFCLKKKTNNNRRRPERWSVGAVVGYGPSRGLRPFPTRRSSDLLCAYRMTLPPLDSTTSVSDFRRSSVAWTSVSEASITGSRLVFWLQPDTRRREIGRAHV